MELSYLAHLAGIGTFDLTLAAYGVPEPHLKVVAVETVKLTLLALFEKWVQFLLSSGKITEVTFKNTYKPQIKALKDAGKAIDVPADLVGWLSANRSSLVSSRVLKSLNRCIDWAIRYGCNPYGENNPFKGLADALKVEVGIVKSKYAPTPTSITDSDEVDNEGFRLVNGNKKPMAFTMDEA